MLRSFLYSLFINLMCFQLMYCTTLLEFNQRAGRLPASFTHKYSIEDLNNKIDAFKVKLKGKETEPDCGSNSSAVTAENELSEEELFAQSLFGGSTSVNSRDDRAFYQYVDSFKENSCGVKESTTTPQAKEDCKPEKVEGFIDAKVKAIMKLEAEKKPIPEFKLTDPEVREFHQLGITLMQEVRKYLVDTSIERETRVELLVNYLGSIALPIRDLIVALRSYTPMEYDGVYFYESLLPEINEELIGGDDLIKDFIQSGPNKLVENYHLEVIQERWGRIKLRYNPNEILARDIVQILKAPTERNYVRSLKWMTMQMMLTQIFTYDAITGEEKPVEIPKSCQNHFNGSLPNEIKMQYTLEEGDQFIDRILSGHGLIFAKGDTQFTEYYMDNVNKDPLAEGYSGLMPFEEYKAAMQGLEKSENSYTKPSLDDYTHFESALNIIKPKISDVFFDDNTYLFGFIDREDEKFYGAKLFEKILTQPSEGEIYSYKDSDDYEVEIDHLRQNLSVFMVELMQRHKVEYWEDLISPDLENQLKRRRVKIDFPSLYGATVWRMWALRQLEGWVNEYLEKDLPIKVKSALTRIFGKTDHKLGNGKTAEEKLRNIKNYLSELKVSDEYIPTRRLQTEEHRTGYALLGNLWSYLRDHTDSLEVAITNEFDFISDQFRNGNPWARTRLSYLLLVDELSSISNGSLPGYSAASMQEFNGESIRSCVKTDVGTVKSRIIQAASNMGITKTLTPSYANHLLDKEEKEMVWTTTIEQSSELFKQKNIRGKRYYQDLEKVTYQTFLTKGDIENFISKELPEGLRASSQDEIDSFVDSEEGRIGDFFAELYKLKGKPEEQLAYFEAFSKDHGIDNSFSAKMNFLVVDNNLKRSVLKSLVKGSAHLRRQAVNQELERFCALEPNDHESFRTLFYMSSKAQNNLNKLTGAPTVPDEVMEKINDKLSSMSPEEWKDMWLGIGAGVLGVAAMLIGGACTGLTGGLCAPAGVAMMAAGAGAMTMQVSLVTREFKRKKEADRNFAKIKEMEELGFSNRNAADNVSRNWFWTAFEAICVIPLIGVTARSLRAGSKLTVVSAAMLARNTGKVGFRKAIKLSGQAVGTINSEADIRFARLILGFDSWKNQSKELIEAITKNSQNVTEALSHLGKAGLDKKTISRGFERIKNIRRLYAKGDLSVYAMARRIGQVIENLKNLAKAKATEGMVYSSKVVVDDSVEAINKQTAKVVSEYFGGHAKGLHYLMGSYSKRLPKAAARMARYERGTGIVGKITLLPWIWNGIRSLRSAQLHKYADQIIRIEKEAAELVAKGGNLEEFVLKNVDDLTDIFMKIPMRKRELPYMFFIQGGPHLGKSLSSIKNPLVNQFTAWASNGIVMRKFFNARSRLIFETMKKDAREVLGLKKFVGAETSLETFKAFQESIAGASENLSLKAKKELIDSYNKLEVELTSKILSGVKNKVETEDFFTKMSRTFKGDTHILRVEASELNEESLRKILFAPDTEFERALGAVAWESVSPEDLFSLREVGEVAHRVIRELAQYENVEEYQRLLNAFKVLVIKRDPGVLEIM